MTNYFPRYGQKRDFGLLCPNMEIRPQTPQKWLFWIFFIFSERPSDFASNEPKVSLNDQFFGYIWLKT